MRFLVIKRISTLEIVPLIRYIYALVSPRQNSGHLGVMLLEVNIKQKAIQIFAITFLWLSQNLFTLFVFTHKVFSQYKWILW